MWQSQKRKEKKVRKGKIRYWEFIMKIWFYRILQNLFYKKMVLINQKRD
jgi:hypothetical protein